MTPRRKNVSEGQRMSQHLYKQAFEPIDADHGTEYPCRQMEINFHHRGRLSHPNKGPFVSAIEATSEIVGHNKETRKIPPLELAAIDRLIDAILDAEEKGYGSDIVIKAFADLDLVFFNGRLRGNVCVQWASDEYFQKWQVPPGTWGFTVRPHRSEKGQCRLYLNAKTILQDPSTDTPFKTMFGTLLHEMCHAYEHIRCFPEECDQGDGHDKHFRTRIHAVHRRAYHLLGLWAIDKWESYRKDHFMSQDWAKEWRDLTDDTKRQSSKQDDREVNGDRSRTVKGKDKKPGRQAEAGCVMM